ncbi:cbb3-type cytochrome c oxidase subunit I [Virgibacillus sp. AGTR]|uniref:cbb3-type cytochrome c oxidase subunit I n=1 Tax=unclassified Virgibacillus TaxID=2620237 RepID=UPI000EF48132|nr:MULTISPECIES: cbb3-type cytochrome c oxidase subunit I [unclassified Virgibacillus]MCC2250707.1 cbb3-type cytochrome c oxidase subunit I [Virgibacillus sp. AGTR]QRZ17199.1 cbb3-type cytochrome c oxidase subunit I [Virgibacillus sp. AGTR]
MELVKEKPFGKMQQALGVNPKDARLSLTYFTVSFIALLIGGFLGLFQGLNRAGLMELPTWFDYYQTLTTHGILLVLVFTTTFVIGYFYAGISHTMGGLLPKVRKFGWTAFGLLVIGVVFVATTVAMGNASVMYTFYPPMQATPLFYIGLVFLVVGIWIAAFGVFINVANWRRNHKGQHIPLLSFFATGVFVLLVLGSIGVTIEVLMLIPWSLGWTETINVMLSRTLFWSFGHTLVNIWYLTAISAWYVAVPKIIGGKLFSDAITRLVVILLVILNIPGGFHHQIVDPGITEGWKFIHVFMSLSIGFPSMMTAFAMFAVFERAGRRKGAKGLLDWFKKLPWGDVRFLAPFIAMVAFIPAGAGGIAQTNNQLNQVVHNSLWIVGHFHLTLGVTVALTFFGITYWLIPYLSKRKLTPKINKLGIIQTIIWTIGMTFMSGAMHLVGLLGSPRRTSYTTYGDNATALSWDPYLIFLAVGGTFLIVGVVLMVYIVVNLMFFAPKGNTEFPIGEPEADVLSTPKWTERWGTIIILLILIVAMGYVMPLTDILNVPGSPPFRTW